MENNKEYSMKTDENFQKGQNILYREMKQRF